MDKRQDLCNYRIDQAKETINVAKLCFENGHYKDAINRAYYAAFYAVKAVLALDNIDFKRHKDVVATFNRDYIASGMYEKEIGRLLSRLQKKRENSDYDDFYIASKEEAEDQIKFAEQIVMSITNKIGKQEQKNGWNYNNHVIQKCKQCFATCIFLIFV